MSSKESGDIQSWRLGLEKEEPMKAVILAVSLFLPISFYSVVPAQLTKMTVGYGSISTNHFPAWMAKESGIFRDNGLDMQLVYFRGGTTAMMALLSRETPISEVAGPSIVSASLRGTDVVMIAGGIVTSDQWLVTRSEIKVLTNSKGVPLPPPSLAAPPIFLRAWP